MSATAEGINLIIAGVFLAVSMVFVFRSFYGMRIRSEVPTAVREALSR